MAHLTGYGAYRLFLAIRVHFTQEKYNFFERNGKTNANKEAYQKRNDRYFFEVLAKDYDAETLRDLYVSNILEGRIYVTDYLDDTAKNTLYEYQKKQSALTYNFGNDLDVILEKPHRFRTYEDQYPEILLLLLQKKITLESFTILNDILHFSDKYDKHYNEDIIWPKISLKIRKYRPFLRYDITKVKEIIKQKVEQKR